jgi:N-acetylglucosamine kinase-like BadF-type ATPase
MSTFQKRWIVAIDAGATTTKAMLCDHQGRMHSETSDSPLKLNLMNHERLYKLLARVVLRLFSRAKISGSLPNAIVIGAAGGGDKNARIMLKSIVRNRYPDAEIFITHDAYIAHYGAFSGNAGVLVTSGTGSIAFGRNDENVEARSGGFGWKLGDEGSGYWIGREAIRAALAVWEGSGEPTKLTDLIQDKFELKDVYGIVPKIYQDDINNSEISQLSEQVHKLALEGDTVSEQIIKNAGVELGIMAVKVAKTLNISPENLNVSLLGSVALGGGDLINSGVVSILDKYKSENSFDDSEVKTDDGSSIPKMPEYPPKDLTIIQKSGPNLIQAAENALFGAARWAIADMTRRKFL